MYIAFTGYCNPPCCHPPETSGIRDLAGAGNGDQRTIYINDFGFCESLNQSLPIGAQDDTVAVFQSVKVLCIGCRKGRRNNRERNGAINGYCR